VPRNYVNLSAIIVFQVARSTSLKFVWRAGSTRPSFLPYHPQVWAALWLCLSRVPPLKTGACSVLRPYLAEMIY
jgi:hypothetical protein